MADKQAELETYYVKMLQPHADARYGKLAVGKVVALDKGRAERWVAVGVAESSSKTAYEKQGEQKQRRADDREVAFQRLNDNQAAYWDVSTHRDALTAPEEGLRRAFEGGVPLVNVDALRDEDGMPLQPDASIEEIVEARKNLHPDLEGVLTAHERSSIQGGGSHYDMPMPLNPKARAIEEEIRRNERNAQSREAGFSVGRDARVGEARQKRAEQRVEAGRVSKEARDAAKKEDLKEPKPAAGSQVGNAPEKKD
jgi:hypothetical protein